MFSWIGYWSEWTVGEAIESDENGILGVESIAAKDGKTCFPLDWVKRKREESLIRLLISFMFLSYLGPNYITCPLQFSNAFVNEQMLL